MKNALRVTMFTAMLFAGALLSGSFGLPLPCPIPPAQLSQTGSLGEPLPVPIPPPQMEKV